MSEQKFKESKSSLVFSQALIDRMRASQVGAMPQEMLMEPEMVEEAEQPEMEPEATQETVEETPTEASEEVGEAPEESRLERMFTEFMDTMNKLFKREQEKEPETPVTEEK